MLLMLQCMYTFCPSSNKFLRLKAQEIIRIWTKSSSLIPLSDYQVNHQNTWEKSQADSIKGPNKLLITRSVSFPPPHKTIPRERGWVRDNLLLRFLRKFQSEFAFSNEMRWDGNLCLSWNKREELIVSSSWHLSHHGHLILLLVHLFDFLGMFLCLSMKGGFHLL